MKPDLSLIDSLRRLIDFAGYSGNLACQIVLVSLLEELAIAAERDKLLPANMAEAPSGRPMTDLRPRWGFAGTSTAYDRPTQPVAHASISAYWRGSVPPQALLRRG